MTKLDHDRPAARLHDNLRREIRRAAAGAVYDPALRDVEASNLVSTAAWVNIQKRFSRKHKTITGSLIDSLFKYLEAEILAFPDFVRNKKKYAFKIVDKPPEVVAARTRAWEKLTKDAKVFQANATLEAATGSRSLIEWYKSFAEFLKENDSGGSASPWDVLNNHVMKEVSDSMLASLETSTDPINTLRALAR